MRPDLRVVDVRLLDPRKVEEVAYTANEIPIGREMRQRDKAMQEAYERERAEFERKREQDPLGRFGGIDSIGPIRPMSMGNPYATNDSGLFAMRAYEGPMPDAILEVRLINRG